MLQQYPTVPPALKAICLLCVNYAVTVHPVLMSMYSICGSHMVYMLPDIIV